ncbi:autotransporter outer membrane beta-barrel domain-containing protein [Enterobacter sp. RIT418]|uniref:autotransporter family protein n=1 Tax=Enterobacter sp. RIT418 TaxID=2202164 RepID=UPI000D43AD12|nr:autotransporter outer membrane beta-barrel domain-containing protein [Enterobacter sp. RIT 418]RAU36243.1 autotransporter outer membrane beta-barrel domain-containing protein [Enterobacter sp. RIT 418]
MSNKSFELNRTTKTLAKLFPALLILTPMIAVAGSIDQSTSVPQELSSDAQYIIGKDVTITSVDTTPAVAVTGSNVTEATNQGNLSGKEDALNVNTGAQRVTVNNVAGASISSTTGNAVNVVSMLGDFNNSGSVTGAEKGILVSNRSSAININNSKTGSIKGQTGISSAVGIGVNNAGTITATNGDGIFLTNGNTKITNAGEIKASANGINVTDSARADITNVGKIDGDATAIFFGSDKDNTLMLKTGSILNGDVITTVSKSNTLELNGTGSEDSNFIGLNDGDGFASVTMAGENWVMTGDIDVIGSGDSIKVNTGSLTLGGDVTNSGNTLVAKNATLQLGTGKGKATLTGGLTNNGTVIFNQGENFTFATGITGTGSVEKVDANILTLTGNNSYSGDTVLHGGTTLVAEGATLGVKGSNATLTVENGATFASAGEVNNNAMILSGGTLAAWNAIAGNNASSAATADVLNGNMTNNGTLLLSGQNNAVGNNYTIKGDYTGAAGSTIVMNSVVADDSSATDHLTITGSSFGQSGISINNIGGQGAQTVNGMEVVSVGGSSDAKMTLAKPVVAGKWEYSLNKHTDGNWYLESTANASEDPADDTTDPDNTSGNTDGGNGGDTGNGDNSGGNNNGGNTDNGNGTGGNTPSNNGTNTGPEVLAPETGAYLGNYLAAQSMFLHKRDDRDQITFRNVDDLNTWMYVKGRYHENNVDGDKGSYDTTTMTLQVGSDFMSKAMENGVLHAGGMFGAGQAKTHSDAKHNVRDAQGKVDGFNVGLYATWQEDQNLRLGNYVDTWAAYSWFNNKVTSDRNDESYHSQGFAASVEVGHAWVVASEKERAWKIEPQAQVIYSYLDQENHTDRDGVRITTLDNDGVLGRLGVKSSYFLQKDVKAWQPYVAVNWLKGAGQNDLAFNGETTSNDTPDDRGQLELGVTGNLNDTTTISLRASGEWGENSYAAYGGHVLLNHRW